MKINYDLKWPSISAFFEQLNSNGNDNNLVFKCLLCSSQGKQISTSRSSNSNRRTHQRVKIYKL